MTFFQKRVGKSLGEKTAGNIKIHMGVGEKESIAGYLGDPQGIASLSQKERGGGEEGEPRGTPKTPVKTGRPTILCRA